jgi:hypothetical protein
VHHAQNQELKEEVYADQGCHSLEEKQELPRDSIEDNEDLNEANFDVKEEAPRED